MQPRFGPCPGSNHAQRHLLGKERPVTFEIGDKPGFVLDEDAVVLGLQEMADVIQDVAWEPDQAAAFRVMDRIVFFEGAIEVNGWKLDRPGCDEDDATFYWEANEFMANRDPRVRAHTFFHDCCHVEQFRAAGNKHAIEQHDRVQREIDAIDRQIAVAERMQTLPQYIQFLRDFEGDQGRILARLDEGVCKTVA
jgi:hypothetical protein